MMRCPFCKSEGEGEGLFRLVAVADNPGKGYAYNLFTCEECDAICRENVWGNKGELWIDKMSNDTEFIAKKP